MKTIFEIIVLIVLIVWILAGILTLLSDKISKKQYFIVWITLVMWLGLSLLY